MEHFKLDILKEALPYIQKFKKKIFVIKLSGKVAASEEALSSLAQEIGLLHQVGFFPVIIHGGGVQVNELAERLGIEQKIINGRRVTDAQTLDLAKMVFNGLINTNITSSLRGLGIPVVGLSGLDGQMIQARKRDPKMVIDQSNSEEIEVDYGFVGDITAVDCQIIRLLLSKGYVPVISSLGSDREGTVYNINADTVAVEIAAGLDAEKMIFLTDLNGVFRDINDAGSKIDQINMEEAQDLMDEGIIRDGMVPKFMAILQMLRSGVASAHIVGAFEDNALLKEIFTNQGIGTMIVNQEIEGKL